MFNRKGRRERKDSFLIFAQLSGLCGLLQKQHYSAIKNFTIVTPQKLQRQ